MSARSRHESSFVRSTARSTYAEFSDSELLREGTVEANDVLWERLEPVFRRATFAARRFGVNNPEDLANEAAGDARLKLLTALAAVQDLRNAPGFVHTTVVNAAKDGRKKEQRLQRRLVSIDDPEAPSIEPRAHDASPEDRLLEAARADDPRHLAVRAAHERLRGDNPRRARVVWWRDVEEWTVCEIAAAERTSEDNVHHILSRGRQDLRRLYAEELAAARGDGGGHPPVGAGASCGVRSVLAAAS